MAENCKTIRKEQIATLTGKAIQDDDTYKAEGGFVPERDQFYFEMQQGEHRFFVGLKDMLISLRVLEKIGEIPEVGEKWWLRMATLYGEDILVSKRSTEYPTVRDNMEAEEMIPDTEYDY